LILANRVINGQNAVLGSKADPAADSIQVDGHGLHQPAPVYVMLNKPQGVISDVRRMMIHAKPYAT
jgi:16S rRNA U516 pseudouridylate synthase RsuA-like enzyme